MHTNRYSVPLWIGRRVEVRETKDKIVFHLVPAAWSRTAASPRPTYQRVTLAEHRPPRGRAPARDPQPEEQAILRAPETGRVCRALSKTAARWSRLPCGNCCACVSDYPRDLLAAMLEAAHYGLYDLDRARAYDSAPRGPRYFLLEEGARR